MRVRHLEVLESGVTSFMTVKGRFTFDTNILIYAIDRDAGHKHNYSKNLIGQAARRDCVLTVQVLGEFFHATTRKNLLDTSLSRKFVRDWLEVFDTVSATDFVFNEAIDTVENHHLSFWDAMLWATARQAGCSVLLSEDMQDGWRLQGLEVINPYSADASARLGNLLND